MYSEQARQGSFPALRCSRCLNGLPIRILSNTTLHKFRRTAFAMRQKIPCRFLSFGDLSATGRCFISQHRCAASPFTRAAPFRPGRSIIIRFRFAFRWGTTPHLPHTFIAPGRANITPLALPIIAPCVAGFPLVRCKP